MASGVKVDESVKMKFDDIKKKKNHRYLVFYIKDEKTICVEKVGTRDMNYQSFLSDLTACGPDDCRLVPQKCFNFPAKNMIHVKSRK